MNLLMKSRCCMLLHLLQTLTQLFTDSLRQTSV